MFTYLVRGRLCVPRRTVAGGCYRELQCIPCGTCEDWHVAHELLCFGLHALHVLHEQQLSGKNITGIS